MAGKNQVAGRAFIKINGMLLRTKNGAKLNKGNPERPAIVGDNGVEGYTEKPTAPYVEGVLIVKAGTPIEQLENFTDGTVTFEEDTGVTTVLTEAWQSMPIEKTIQDSGGEAPVKFFGMDIEDV